MPFGGESLFDRLSNEGRWGPDDERGTLNLITSDAVLRGIAAVRRGIVVSMGRELVPDRALPAPARVAQRMLYQQHVPNGALDSVEIAPHGLAITHVDAPGHVYYEGRVYNGRRAEDIVAPDGLTFGDVAALAGGIVTRGVLLDVAGVRSVPHLEPSDVVTSGDLELAAARAGVTVLPGDAVVVRTGIERQPESDFLSNVRRTGLDASCVTWMRERDVAVYAGDCIESFPSTGDLDMPLHQIGLAGMGLALVDAPMVEPLAETCTEHDQATFLFICAPLPIRGGTGSAVNPLAVL